MLRVVVVVMLVLVLGGAALVSLEHMFRFVVSLLSYSKTQKSNGQRQTSGQTKSAESLMGYGYFVGLAVWTL